MSMLFEEMLPPLFMMSVELLFMLTPPVPAGPKVDELELLEELKLPAELMSLLLTLVFETLLTDCACGCGCTGTGTDAKLEFEVEV